MSKFDGLLDEQVLAQYLAGEPNAIGELHRRYWGELKSLVKGKYLKSDDAASEDVVAKTFEKLFERADQFDATQPLRPWLRTAVIRFAIDEIRRRRTRGFSLEDAPENEAGGTVYRFDPADHREKSAEERAILNEQTTSLQDAMESLLPGDREAVETVWLKGLTLREGADLTQVPYGTFSSRYTRGMRLLKSRLQGFNDRQEAA